MYSLAIDVASIRPINLALKWKLPQKQVIEACMQAMVVGLLEMRWEILCPQCRVVKVNSAGLHDIPKSVHCSSCCIDFGLDFNENIEMIFFPAQWLRQVNSTTYCMLSPRLTPQITAQIRIHPNHEKIIDYSLEPGIYRCRILEEQRSVTVIVNQKDASFPVIELTQDKMHLLPEKKTAWTLINNSQNARFFIIENLKYKENTLTAQKVSTMHVFRQLCPEQLIRPGDSIGISRLTILFTDLKDSTAFYYKVGEAQAYHIVREHFGFLSEIIYKHNGTLVKTIGDSVMAVFYDSKDGVAACLDVRDHLEEFNRKNKTEISIKLGIHEDNCISVNMNNLMDYFGTAINVVARLHALSDGNDIIISEEIMQNPAVELLLKKNKKLKKTRLVKGVPHPLVFYSVEPIKKKPQT
jgi:class 3 adenylate cyclase